ncbi:MAG TPA: zf-HC2 domain-containing protein [Pseudogracilibacillus sp.]|nr:zf-HC2 domain-containing protein [Pseudogracilibacillus sp.]
MNTCPEKMIDYMHAYLDGDISTEEEQQLQQHLQNCPSCKQLFADLTEAVQFIEQAEPMQAPSNFVEGVMAKLPKEQVRQVKPQNWLRKHPFFAAAALFFILMSASLFSGYGNDEQFSVTSQPNLVIEGETVIVPKGEVVKGDVVVKNGDLRVEGEVDGNVTVIKGSKYMASTAVVTGSSEEIDRAFGWLWYKIKETANNLFSTSKEEDSEE